MEMTQTVRKEIDEYNWFRELCGHDLYEKKMKQYYKEDLEKEREKGEKIGFVKGEQSGFTKGEQSGFTKGEQSGFLKGSEQTKENLALKMLEFNYHLDEISRMTDLSMERILQLAKDHNLGNR